MSAQQTQAQADDEVGRYDARVSMLLGKMTLDEKIGQMSQVNSPGPELADDFREALRAARIGAVMNEVDVDRVNEMQRIAVEESRLGIPLLIGRDVIHGFRTVLPIPLGQAATWNPDIVRRGAEVAAAEAAASGINWTFAPMLDVSRDPRWGRIAESFGEDPYLVGELGAAMVLGFQGDDLSGSKSIASCAKHFAGYGAAEAGRDYDTTNIPENELRNVHLRPFQAAIGAGVASFMASFGDLNGVPGSANEFLMRQVLRNEWGYSGFVVSDWDSIRELSVHGLTEDDRGSALAAIVAGINMEMASTTYRDHVASLVDAGDIDLGVIDQLVAAILQSKVDLGLFDRPYTDPGVLPVVASGDNLAVAYRAALESIVMLQNERAVLPLSPGRIGRIAVIGPLADAPYEQLGTWIFDGDPDLSITPLAAIRSAVGEEKVNYVRALETSRSRSTAEFDAAGQAAADADVALLFLGEESILSGEAHCRADIDLPGSQAELVSVVRASGTPVIAIIMAGRPLTLTNIIDKVDAVLYAWHPGTMGGPAIADILFGVASPSGKLPVTFPRMVGQVPIYYSHKNTGRPPTEGQVVEIDAIDAQAPQTSFGMTAFHLDAGYLPLFPFGFGLGYTTFEYANLELSRQDIRPDESLSVSALVTNTGDRNGIEVVQLYVRDRVGSVTRPVRELKGFRRIELAPGESRQVTFELAADDLSFFGRKMTRILEPGAFDVWIGGDSNATLGSEFRITGHS